MKRVMFSLAAIMLVAAPLGLKAEGAQLDHCFAVRATADARNPRVSTERAEHRLRRYIADHLSSPGGKSVGPTHTHCIRNACEASALVCHH